MATYTSRLADGTKILMKREMAAVLADLRHKALQSKNARPELGDLPAGRVLRPTDVRDSPPASGRCADRTAEAPPADSGERCQGRTTPDGAAVVGPRHLR